MSSTATTADEPGSAGTDESVMQAVADAMTNASQTATRHAAKVSRVVGDGSAQALESVSHAAYTGAYCLAYAVVYPVTFGVRLLPQENAVMRGFRDGGRAATDAVGARSGA
jgi:hypothetical protein